MMTDTPGNPDAARVFQAWRTAAIGRVTQMLDGSGLEIKELANGLIITNSRNPENGKIHIAYTDGYVSWERVVWDYWGRTEGFEYEETDDGGPRVGAAKILRALAPA